VCGLSYALQLDAIERETLALIGVVGAARAQGADVDIPTLAEAKAHFDEWLLGDLDGTDDDEKTLKSALGLSIGR
jgi:hypothetical protein